MSGTAQPRGCCPLGAWSAPPCKSLPLSGGAPLGSDQVRPLVGHHHSGNLSAGMWRVRQCWVSISAEGGTELPPYLMDKPWLPQSGKDTFPSWTFAPDSGCCGNHTWMQSTAAQPHLSPKSLPGSLCSCSSGFNEKTTDAVRQLTQFCPGLSETSTSSVSGEVTILFYITFPVKVFCDCSTHFRVL